ncbi:cerebrin prohormone-like [Physella acuta]|uniref:cerebrin prohormone-like n=1 Tax=Physella acuta TaxID=109671 RepID=UPI0027DDBB4C|nr:cerebrin prohormone-like [Physella acuta]
MNFLTCQVMLSHKTSLVVLAFLALSWLVQGTTASQNRQHVRSDDKIGLQIVSLAKRIINLATYGFDWEEIVKRNGGTADTIYNLPDLEDIGRK